MPDGSMYTYRGCDICQTVPCIHTGEVIYARWLHVPVLSTTRGSIVRYANPFSIWRIGGSGW